MEKNTVNLSSAQSLELKELISSLVTKYEVEYIFCFGCSDEHCKSVGCFSERFNARKTHYFLLMLTTQITRIEHEVQDHVNGLSEDFTISIIVHGLQTATNAVAQGSRFFCSACRDGVQLYSANGLRLSLDYPILNPATTFAKAQKHFFHRFGMACGFLESASTSYDNGFYGNCMFELHQCMEQACIAVIRVYMAYRSDMHNLARLLNLCKCFCNPQVELYPRKSEEDDRLFQLLLKSYSETRYKDDYQIVDHDADELCTQVRSFLETVKKLCNKRLAEYRQDAEKAGREIESYLPALPASLFI